MTCPTCDHPWYYHKENLLNQYITHFGDPVPCFAFTEKLCGCTGTEETEEVWTLEQVWTLEDSHV